MTVATNVKRIIRERGLLQKRVAENAGFTEARFSDLLNGRKVITADDIERITRALKVTPNEIFGIDSKPAA